MAQVINIYLINIYYLKVNFGEFLSAIREPLSERRLKLICKVFSFFDTKKEAMVNIDNLGIKNLI